MSKTVIQETLKARVGEKNMKVNAGLLVDIGNSETRVTVLLGGREKTVVLSNHFAELPPNYVAPSDYTPKNSTILHLIEKVEGTSKAIKIPYANGLLADVEFIGKCLRPSSIHLKTEQMVTKLTMVLAVKTALEIIAEMKEVEIAEVDVTFDVSVLLPPTEHDINIEEMKALVHDIGEVSVLMPEIQKKIKIGEVNVLPEGIAAFFGVFFEENEGDIQEVPENADFGEGYVLIFDIGAGTTDVVLVKDTAMVSDSKQSYSAGGNKVISELGKLIQKKYKFKPKDVAKVIETGVLIDSSKEIDVSELITQAREDYARGIKVELVEYLERMEITLRDVKGVLVVGGGTLPTIKDGVEVSDAMSAVLLRYFKTLAPNIREVSTLGKNPRMLNIEGLKFIHKYS